MAILKSRPVSQFPSIEKIRDEAVKVFGQDLADLMLQTFRNVYDDLNNLNVQIVDTLPTGLGKEDRGKKYLVRGTGSGGDSLYMLVDTGGGGYGFELQADKTYADSVSLWEVDGSETQLKTADEIDMQSKKIINVTDPASNQDAATKAYSDLMKIASILDYGTSASSSTARAQAALKICYGSVAVAHEADGSGHTHITNLPFTDANSYIIELTENRDTSDAFEMNVAATRVSGSEAIFLNPSAANDKVVFWFAIGI